MPFLHRKITVALALLATLSVAKMACADSFPSRPITLLVPLAAGSTADIASRLVGSELSKELKQPVIVINKPGAGGAIEMAELARDAPDGYTIGLAAQGQMVFNLVLYKHPGYTQKDFAPLAMLGSVANVLVVPPNSPFHSVHDIIVYAKAHPGDVTYSSGGIGTSHHLSSVLFAQKAGLKLMHVPYDGAPQGTVAVMSAEVQMAFFNTTTELSPIRTGKLRALAVTSATRSPLLPTLPTMQEAGVPGYEVSTWEGFVAPAGTPAAVVQKLHDALQTVFNAPRVKKAMLDQGIDISAPMSPKQMSEFMAQDLVKWTPIIKASGAAMN